MKKASDILKEAAAVIEERGKLRDKDDGERSMSRAVEAYTALRGNVMESELDGWLFMICLKMARATAGKNHLDDFTDLCGYGALAAEYVSNDTSQFWVEHALENGVNLRTPEEIDAYAKETEARWEDRKEALDELTRVSEELGLYESEGVRERCEAAEQSESKTNADWIKWEGGECPVDPDVKVQVQLRCDTSRPTWSSSRPAGEWRWRWEKHTTPGDIIAYRVVKE